MTTITKPAEAAPAAVDPAKVEAFVNKVVGDTSAFSTTLLAAIGDKLGLFKSLAVQGPTDSRELAARARIDERYAREWLAAMASAGYLAYDPATRRFTLPRENVPALAQEGGPFFFGGVHQMLKSMASVVHKLEDAFRSGGGVPQSAYDADTWEGMERFTRGWFDNHLIQEWLPAMPDVLAHLERGADVADVGCGRGRALIKLAQAFPNSRFVGFDAFGPTIGAAAENARMAGVAGRVRFEHRDVAARGLPGQFDVITTFDVVHDAAEPLGLLRAIRAGLAPGGRYICLEINSSDKLEENAGPLGAMFYGVSLLYCMTTSLAEGGAGLGTCGMNPAKVRELCAAAGFSEVRRLPIDNPFNVIYEIKP